MQPPPLSVRQPSRGLRLRPEESADVAMAAAAATAAAFAVLFLPPGSAWRVLLVWPLLLFVPGFLLLQAMIVPIAVRRGRLWHAFLAVGISPALVGLLALSTALVPGGFRPLPIVLVLAAACLVLAATALLRRSLARRAPLFVPGPDPPRAERQEP